MLVHYETKTGKFNQVSGGKYYPLTLGEEVAPRPGDTLTTGEMWDQNRVARGAAAASGLPLEQVGDVIYKFGT